MSKTTMRQARALRHNAPATEQKLWRLLRSRRLGGLKFRRQVPIGPYVADFVCLRHRLIVEADGPLHDADHDRARDAWLGRQGFRVLRFRNEDICADGPVLSAILDAVAAPPLGGEA